MGKLLFRDTGYLSGQEAYRRKSDAGTAGRVKAIGQLNYLITHVMGN